MESIISQKGQLFNPSYILRFFWIILVLAAIIGAFLLGKISSFLEKSPEFTFQFKEEGQMQNGSFSTSTIVASRGGTKYYFVWCKGAGNIKESNKMYFATEQLAQMAGYTLAANCR